MSDLIAPSEKVDLVKSNNLLGTNAKSSTPVSPVLADSVRPDFVKVQANMASLMDTVVLKQDEAKALQISNQLQTNLHRLRVDYFNNAKQQAGEAYKSYATTNSDGKRVIGEPMGNTSRSKILKFQNKANEIIQAYRNEMAQIDPRVRILADKNTASYVSNYSNQVYEDLAKKANDDFIKELGSNASMASDNYARTDPDNPQAMAKAEGEMKQALHLFMVSQGYNSTSPVYKEGMRKATSKAELSHMTAALLTEGNLYKGLEKAQKLYGTAVKNGSFTYEDQLSAMRAIRRQKDEIEAKEERERARREAAAARAAAAANTTYNKQMREQNRILMEMLSGNYSNPLYQQVLTKNIGNVVKAKKDERQLAIDTQNKYLDEGNIEAASEIIIPPEVDENSQSVINEAIALTQNQQNQAKLQNTQDGIIAAAVINTLKSKTPEELANITNMEEFVAANYQGADPKSIVESVNIITNGRGDQIFQSQKTGVNTEKSDSQALADMENTSIEKARKIVESGGDLAQYAIDASDGKIIYEDAQRWEKCMLKKIGQDANKVVTQNIEAIISPYLGSFVNTIVDKHKDIAERLIGDSDTYANLSKSSRVKNITKKVQRVVNKNFDDLINEFYPDLQGEELVEAIKRNPNFFIRFQELNEASLTDLIM